MVKKEIKKSMGLEENIAGLLSYIAMFITGLIFFFGEKENKFVRFHALQSIIVSIVIAGVSIILAILFGIIGAALWFAGLWIIFTIISVIWLIFGLAVLVLWIVLMVKAYQGQKFKLPIIGDFCEKQVG